MQRHKLSDMLARPMQQITRYPLLLDSVMKETQNQEERKKIQEMIEGVSRATHQLNFEMNNNDLQRQLLDIQGQIDGYDCVDQDEFERLTQRKCLINLVEPMHFPPPFDAPPYLYRRLFFRGDLKMRESKQGPKVFLEGRAMNTANLDGCLLLRIHRSVSDLSKERRQDEGGPSADPHVPVSLPPG